MKMREILEKVRAYYRAGHGPSLIGGKGPCLYLHPKANTACAIGCLLSPEDAEAIQAYFGSQTVGDILSSPTALEQYYSSVKAVHDLKPLDLTSDDGFQFLVDLQRAHDIAALQVGPTVKGFLPDLLEELDKLEAEYADKLLS